ncbi:hypothetical protein NLI96_g13335 [Meripilus lineatus]|uniref:Uncharacterized protein n=1 Tax=Meripilus lineatus TaxID=2056292 RepID=A0AAD5UNA7_9APHY|nr:hypothetical protein NLI96_g13335 [Physisporinus lineatus]
MSSNATSHVADTQTTASKCRRSTTEDQGVSQPMAKRVQSSQYTYTETTPATLSQSYYLRSTNQPTLEKVASSSKQTMAEKATKQEKRPVERVQAMVTRRVPPASANASILSQLMQQFQSTQARYNAQDTLPEDEDPEDVFVPPGRAPSHTGNSMWHPSC